MAASAPAAAVKAGAAAGPPAPVGHHFDNLRQQQSTVRFGMWLFLVTEVLFFGGAFCAYTVYRIWYPREFEAGSAVLNVGIATVNTFLLLLSSLTVTLATRACYVGNRSGLQMWLGLTIVLGAVFLGLKAREYHLDYQEGLVPGGKTAGAGAWFRVDAPGPNYGAFEFRDESRFVTSFTKAAKEVGYPLENVNVLRVQLFFLFYYSMTGLHVLHMVIGLGLLGWQFVFAKRGFFDPPERYVYVEVLSLYWHFVDMVWMFLMPLLYLTGPHRLGQVGEGLKQAFGLAGGHH